ncbi:MAG: transposase [Planctomycetota bacterium]|nr:transposase [Planctomycetota bacterium]
MDANSTVHECGCESCRSGDDREREDHLRLILLMSRLDEQQRRWLAGCEAARRGHGGIRIVSEITGLHPETIRRGRDELAGGLADRPSNRVRLPGGGRPRAEKKILR